MHKRKLQTKKAVNNKLFNKKHLFWIAPLSITFGAIWISLAIYQAFGPTPEQIEQRERLDANAEHLKFVKSSIEKEVPGVVSAMYKKECVQEYRKYSEGPIWCGGKLGLVVSGADEMKWREFAGMVENKLEQGGRINIDLQAAANETRSDSGVVSVSGRQDDRLAKCEFSEVYYPDAEMYIRSYELPATEGLGGGIYRVSITCTERVNSFLPGYDSTDDLGRPVGR